jgi:hypothetical protein
LDAGAIHPFEIFFDRKTFDDLAIRADLPTQKIAMPAGSESQNLGSMQIYDDINSALH